MSPTSTCHCGRGPASSPSSSLSPAAPCRPDLSPTLAQETDFWHWREVEAKQQQEERGSRCAMAEEQSRNSPGLLSPEECIPVGNEQASVPTGQRRRRDII